MTQEEARLKGVGASPGIAIGRAYLIDRRKVKTPKRHITAAEVEGEQRRFDDALRRSHEQLERVKQKLAERASGDDPFQILEAHQLILRDEHLVEPTLRSIATEHVNAEWALRKTVEHIKGIFDSVDDQYFRERRSDVDFVGDRVLRNLLGMEQPLAPPPDAVVVAHELSPADIAQLQRAAIAGFLTDVGGKTSHTAILARAVELPAVVGLEDITHRVGNGDLIIIDGTEGEVILHPSAPLVAQYRGRARQHAAREEEQLKTRDLESVTRDGHRVRLMANVELNEEVPSALEHGAEGVGLYRTEFLFLGRSSIPTEEDHYQLARRVLDMVGNRPVTFRTFDLGGEKAAAALGQHGPREANPALGLRSVRLCLRERGLFKAQLRGLLRASVHGEVKIMFPMISGVGELREVLAVLDEVKRDLSIEGVAFRPDVPVGIMIEMPSAAMTADLLAKHVAFFAVGTNDLIQYSLAIDRVNEHVSYLYEPLHPAILRLLRFVVHSAHAAGIPVCVCGEMAGEALFLPVLLGLGVDELSMNSLAIPVVKAAIRGAEYAASCELAERVVNLPTAGEVESAVRAARG